MRASRLFPALAGTLALTACATLTPVIIVPGASSNMAAFQKDDAACRAQASTAAYGTATPQPGSLTGPNAQWRSYFATLAQCAESHGDTVAPVPWTAAYAYAAGYPVIPLAPLVGPYAY